MGAEEKASDWDQFPPGDEGLMTTPAGPPTGVPTPEDVARARAKAREQVLSFLGPQWPHLNLSILVRSACSC
jgi:hypothetical protein